MAADYKLSLTVDKYVRFFDGQFLQDQDFIDEQKYHVGRQNRHHRTLHVSGVAEGLTVYIPANSVRSVRVRTGFAIDPHGRQILLTSLSEYITLPEVTAVTDYWLYIAYHLVPADLPSTSQGVEEETRWHDAPYLFASTAQLGVDDSYDGPDWNAYLDDGPPPPVLLAKVTVQADDTLTIDETVRQYSGLRLPGPNSAAPTLRTDVNGSVGIWLVDNDDEIERVTISAEGKVGLGNSTPTAALQINNTLSATTENRTLVGLRVAPTFDEAGKTAVKKYGLLVESGDVGIGTANPGAKLDVVGTIQGDYLQVNVQNDTGEGGELRLDGSAGENNIHIDNYGGNLRIFNIADDRQFKIQSAAYIAGNLGIGKDDPGAKLEVSGGKIQLDGSQQIVFTNGDVSNNLKLQLWSGYGLGINSSTLFYAANGRHSWRDNNGTTERMALTTATDGGLTVLGTGDSSIAGNLGIGTTSPQESLHVNGAVRGDQLGALRISTDFGYVDIGPKGEAWSHFYTDRDKYYFNKEIRVGTGLIGSFNEDLSLRTAGTTRMTILNSDGKVGIGTTAPMQTLDVKGRMHLNNGVIQRGGDAITDTNDLGLYSRNEGSWIRIVTNSAPIKFFTDDGKGTTPSFEIESGGTLAYKGKSYFTTTGTVDHDDTISVPSGTTKDDWNVFVSPNEMGLEEGSSDKDNALLMMQCSVDSNWKVTARYRFRVSTGTGTWRDGKANYILVPK